MRVCALIGLFTLVGVADAAMLGWYWMPDPSDLVGWGNAWFSPSPSALVASYKAYSP